MSSVNLSEKRCLKVLLTGKSLFLLSCISIIMLSGCSRYQYISINSKLYQNEKNEFVNENDTVMIKYTFPGENFPLTITIYNKLLQPIYIDLERSPVIINNFQITGYIYNYEQISFIAPLSSVTVISNPLRNQFINLNPTDSLTNVPIVTNVGITHSFSEETTPMYFRSILALTTHEDYTSPTFFDYSFWVSDIFQTMAGPASITYKPSNQFYIRKTTGFGKFINWTVPLVTIFILGFLASGQ